MYKFKIEEITINTLNGVESIIPKSINVLVGPNSSGKSRFLKEIRDFLSGDQRDIKIINSINYPYPQSFEDFNATYNLSTKLIKSHSGNWLFKAYSNKPAQPLNLSSNLENYFTRSANSFNGDWKTQFQKIIEGNNQNSFLSWFGPLFFQYLGTEERLTLCKAQKNYGLDNSSTNFFSSFKYDSKLLLELSNKVKQLFNKDIYLDFQTLGDRLVFRVGKDFDYIRNKVIGTEKIASKLYGEKMLDDEGDGLKSFVSTFLTLKANQNNILLLDEPEAFLHPPLARQLGEMIGESTNTTTTIFIATHSVEILKGILSKSQDVNVIRIMQPELNKNEIRILDQDVLNNILGNPLLRVSRVLEGIFCEKVIITESEADELVYQELIEKAFPESGVYFAHGQNKQTLSVIGELYKEIGVNFEIITDFDILRIPSEFYRFLLLTPFNENRRQQVKSYAEKLRDIINNSVSADGISPEELEKLQKKRRNEVYHKSGLRFFSSEEQKRIRETFLQLSSHHLHIIETGELETVLEEFNFPYAEKNKWIIGAINKISELDSKTIQSSSIYDFLKRIVYN